MRVPVNKRATERPSVWSLRQEYNTAFWSRHTSRIWRRIRFRSTARRNRVAGTPKRTWTGDFPRSGTRSQTNRRGAEKTRCPSEKRRPISTRLVSRSAWRKAKRCGRGPSPGLFETEFVRDRQFFAAFGAAAI